MTEDVAALDDRYVETLRKQADLRRRGYETLEENGEFPPLDVDAIAGVCRERADGFDGRLLFFGASDFGHPAVFVPRGTDARADKVAVLDELHAESGKWQGTHEALRTVRTAVLEADPHLHKGFAALVSDGDVAYDLDAGTSDEYNFVTIRQVVGLVDWLTNSFQADALTTAY